MDFFSIVFVTYNTDAYTFGSLKNQRFLSKHIKLVILARIGYHYHLTHMLLSIIFSKYFLF